jgi:hypothetical protein
MRNVAFRSELAESYPDGLPRLTVSRGLTLWKARPLIADFLALGIQALFSPSRREGFDVHIRNDPARVIHCVDLAELRFLIQGLYCCQEVLAPSDVTPSVERLMALFRSIRERLEPKFTPEEKSRGAIGGWPGFKELVLYCLTRRFRPQDVIETGVAQGISSVFILDALRQNGLGHLTSIDLPNLNPEGYMYEDGRTKDPVYVKQSLGVGWLVPDALRSQWTLIIGPSQEILPTLTINPQLFFHDSKHTYEHMLFEFEWAWQRLAKGGLLVGDDIWWNNAFRDFLAAHKGELVPISTKIVGAVIRV